MDLPRGVVRPQAPAMLAAVLAILVSACSPAATPSAAPVAGAPKVLTAADLAGASPDAFNKVFTTANSTSTHPATSQFAGASKPLAAGTKMKVGFIFVGSEKDLGYNQAAYEGSQYLAQQHPELEVLYAENIPETAQVEAVEEQMIQQGAKIIFATSYGYADPTIDEAAKHPDVIFLHQGALKSTDNFGAYFGDIWQLEYIAGRLAGKQTKSNKLGFIAAFPIPQTLLNVNAFELGAKSVNPQATTTFVLLNDWCDPAKQAAAAKTLLDSGVDVVTQHQDCTGTVTQAAERAGAFVTGYHEDASSAAPKGWLTGAVWNWGPVYSELVSEIEKGTYKTNVIFAGIEAGFVKLAPFGKAVPQDQQTDAMNMLEGIRKGTVQPFAGPISDQSGTVKIPSGTSPSNTDLQTINWLVQGVIGSAS